MKHILVTTVAFAILCTQTAFGAASFTISGATQLKKQDESIVVSPYNQASFLGTANDGILTMLLPESKLELPLDSPLYRLTDAYRDQLTLENSAWGVRRYIQKTVFDGSEGWQLETDSRYRNKNTTVFTLALDEAAAIPDLYCSHFQTMMDTAQKTNTIDGVSLSRDLKTLYVRVMNFRNMKTVDAFTAYLASQNEAGTPLSILTAQKAAVFIPLPEEYQKRLSQIDPQQIGLVDAVMPELSREMQTSLPSPFLPADITNPALLAFAQSVTDVKVYHGAMSDAYALSAFRLLPDGNGELSVLRTAAQGDILYTGVLPLPELSFLQSKPVEVRLTAERPEDGSLSVFVDLNRLAIPTQDLQFSDPQIRLAPQCFMEKQLVVPKTIPLPPNTSLQIYENNILLYSAGADGGQLSLSPDPAEGSNVVTLAVDTVKTSYPLYLNGEKKTSVTLAPIPQETISPKEIRVMLLGDSLINQQYYPTELEKSFQDSPLKLSLVGTKGAGTALHEGRGGWTAYDYCNIDKKYGEENPFLHNGKFDFLAYMEQNQFDGIDYVVLNLGINDLNLVGHNTNDEIFSYFEEIIGSIRAYAPDCKIFLNTPTMLFAKDTTEHAKNTRLAFIQSLNQLYGSREDEGYYVVPIYLSLDPFLDYRFEPRKLNAENQDKSMEVTDTTHPALSGYQKIAFLTNAYLQYAESK